MEYLNIATRKTVLWETLVFQIMETHNVYIFLSTQLDLGIFIYLSIYLRESPAGILWEIVAFQTVET